jgi:flagellar biosynthesis protein FlhB
MTEKTELPTSKKLAEARKNGLVAYSQDFTAAMILIGGVLALFASAHFIYQRIAYLYTNITINYLNTSYDQNIEDLLIKGVKYIAITLSPVLLLVFLFAFFANIAQVGFCFSPLRWHQPIRKIITLSSLTKIPWGILKLSVIAAIYFFIFRSVMPQISHLMNAQASQILSFLSKEAFYISAIISVTLFIFSLVDLMYQKWRFTQNMKMTPQEIQEEHKNTAQPKKYRPQQTAIPNLVISGSVYAIALKYDTKNMSIPQCTHKGVVKHIEKIAIKNKIPIIKNPSLVQDIYVSAEVGSNIPSNFYHRVAQVLATLKQGNTNV